MEETGSSLPFLFTSPRLLVRTRLILKEGSLNLKRQEGREAPENFSLVHGTLSGVVRVKGKKGVGC